MFGLPPPPSPPPLCQTWTAQKIVPLRAAPSHLRELTYTRALWKCNGRYLHDFCPSVFPIICALDRDEEGGWIWRDCDISEGFAGQVAVSVELSSTCQYSPPVRSYFETNSWVWRSRSAEEGDPDAQEAVWSPPRGGGWGRYKPLPFLRFVSFSFFLSLSLCGKEERVHAEGSDYRFEWS